MWVSSEALPVERCQSSLTVQGFYHPLVLSCGQNRDNGINSILHDQPVMFKDVLVTEMESDSGKSDMKTMLKTLPHLISEIPDTNQIKTYISELFSSEIVMSKNLNRVTEFYFLVLQIVHDYSEQLDNSESESDED